MMCPGPEHMTSDLHPAPGAGPGCAVGKVQVGVAAAAAQVHHDVVPH